MAAQTYLPELSRVVLHPRSVQLHWKRGLRRFISKRRYQFQAHEISIVRYIQWLS